MRSVYAVNESEWRSLLRRREVHRWNRTDQLIDERVIRLEVTESW